jgi:hypothetical protein
MKQTMIELSDAETEKDGLLNKFVFWVLKKMSTAVRKPLKIVAINVIHIQNQGMRGHNTVARFKNWRDYVLRETPKTPNEVLNSKLTVLYASQTWW